ncbi:MAG: DoxX family protein [Bacteroidota bacterium]
MKKKILLIFSILFGFTFINSGLNKFFNFIPPPENMSEDLNYLITSLQKIGWVIPLLGSIEIIAGILFILPKTRALGAIMMFPVMIGIMLTHTLTDTSGLPVALVLFAINLWGIIVNWEKYRPMVN